MLNIPSPSPSFTVPLPVQQASPQLLPQPHAGSVSPQVRPTVRTDAVPPTPSTSTPTSAYFSAADSDASSPNTATHHEHPLHTLPTPISTAISPLSPLSPSPSATLGLGTLTTLSTSPSTAGSHPPSPKNPNKRLSFISYTDLLSSTPASTVPLSTLVLGSAIEPPPHLPSVIGLPQAQAHATGSSAGSLRDAAGALVVDPTSDLSNDVGGEWEREGLGRGLEERLESLMPVAGKA